jgi:[ribosomal protein S5]-alanine N-acetyltransferase
MTLISNSVPARCVLRMHQVIAIMFGMESWEVAGEPPLRLELVEPEQSAALERFERTNREFFARHVGDRGDEFFEQFGQRLEALVAENRSGQSLCFVLLSPVGEVVGRVNLYDIDQPGLTELGFRVAENAQGNGVATRGVLAALRVAGARGVGPVIARASTLNIASQHVLEKCGFSVTGPAETPADSAEVFIGYRRDL